MMHIVFHLQSTYTGAKRWVKELQRMAEPQMVIALVGNKQDLNLERSVHPEVSTTHFTTEI